jgi:predicted permease
MKILLQDARFALRQMLQKPGFTLLVVTTMALGIGANAAIFSVLDAILLRPLPYEKPDKLIKVWTRFTGIGAPDDQNWVSPPEFRDLQQLNHSFSNMAAMAADSVNLGVKGSPQRVLGAAVSPSLFGMLGAQPMLGRTFLAEEAQPGREKEVLLSYGLWRRVFAANRNIIGSTVDIDGAPMTVVGVMPEGFGYPNETEIWAPLAFGPNDLSENARGGHGLEVLARLRDGVSPAQAQADMDRAARTMIEQHASYPYNKYNFGIILHPLLEETVGDVKPLLLVLMAAVGLVLLIACANVANLLLARATERQREVETRIALGATGVRVSRQLLTESVMLALAGGLAGLAVTPLALKGLVAIAAKSLPRALQTSIDLRALALTLLTAVATGIVFGLAPALQIARKRSFEALRTGRNTEGKQPRQLRNALVVFETAISLLLLVGAGLLLRSFAEVLKVDPGFKADGVLTMRVSLPDAVYGKPEQVRAFYGSLVERVQKLPGVAAAGVVSALPLGDPGGSGTVTIDTQAVPLEERTPEADMRTATPNYFRAMGIQLVAGRAFEPSDADGAPRVAMVDESLAQAYWPGQDAVGKRLHFGGIKSTSPWMTVVGVVRHVRNRTLEARSRVEVYAPQAQMPFNGMTLAVRTAGDPASLAPTIQREVSAIDPDLPVYRVRTMAEVMGESVQRRRLGLILLEVFAGLALALAAVGIYGVTSYGVAQRQVEIGVRMALGADRGQVLRMMIAGSMATIAVGLALGVLLSPLVTRMMRGMLFAVRPADPLAIAGGAGVLVAMAFLAVLIPARRATRVSPMKALRYE